MNDLALWRLLTSNPLRIDEVVPALESFAFEPLWARIPFLGFLTPLLLHSDAKIRSATLTAFGGAQGYLAYRTLIGALDDPATRDAALEALRVSASQGWPSCRWAHALFHPDSDIRKQALDPQRPWPDVVPTRHAIYLLADPATRELVLRQIERRLLYDAEVDLILDLAAARLITLDVARTCLTRTSPEAWWYLVNNLDRFKQAMAAFRDLSAEELAASPTPRECLVASLTHAVRHAHAPLETRHRADLVDALAECYRESPWPAEIKRLARDLDPNHPALQGFAAEPIESEMHWEPSFGLEPMFPSLPSLPPLSEDQQFRAKEVEGALAFPPLASHWTRQLEAYLELGTRQPFLLRYAAARELQQLNHRSDFTLPTLLQKEFHPDSDPSQLLDPSLLCDAKAEWLMPIARSVFLADPPIIQNEYKLLDLIGGRDWNEPEAQEVLSLLVAEGRNPGARREARERLHPSFARSARLQRLARAFAWGVRLGRALIGRLFQLEMISNERLGYTRFNEDKLYISPMPILRDEPHGDAVVRGLILHEYGHHLYHKSPAALEVWETADKSGLGDLLNLVADEHLERNLRTINPLYGHLLRRLNSYAFQQRKRELALDMLLNQMHVHAFGILTQLRLKTARAPECVVVQNGRLLRLMEAHGMSFARFMRALRMGLGDRHGDPKVAEAFKLFRGRFRHNDMDEMLTIARKLKEIFGDETKLLDWMNQDESLRWPDDGDFPTREELKDAMGKVHGNAGGKSNDGDPSRPRLGGSGGMNLNPDVHFLKIDRVVKLKHDPSAHANLARQIAREAQILRQCLRGLGLGFTTETMRTQGRRLDRNRLRDLILRSDPRVLIARRIERKTDLFLGVAIDCSSSMGGQRIEKAKLFGTLLAEAVRNQRDIDLRLFGFTESTIYDAGAARTCAVHALQANGGNNDAAGLQHAFECAQASKRKAKLLIMISDGMPTNCSVAALSHLVNRLTRRRYCCAQVAVAPLEQICFPQYILLDEQNLADSVRKFGAVIRRLVQQALGLA